MSTMNQTLNGLKISIAMPIFNESDGIAETLTSIDGAFRDSGAIVTVCIQNDVSTDNTLHVLTELATSLQLNIAVETNQQNSGHGPTTFAAYRRALNTGCSIVMQLDSDGQFEATERTHGSVNFSHTYYVTSSASDTWVDSLTQTHPFGHTRLTS